MTEPPRIYEATTPTNVVPKKTVLTHAGYLGAMATVVIVYLVTLKLGSHSDAVTYIGFAGTLSSLILSLLAIYLAMSATTSNTSLLDTAKHILHEAQKSQGAIASSALQNIQAADSLSAIVAELPNSISQLRQDLNAGLKQINMVMSPNAVGGIDSLPIADNKFSSDTQAKKYFLETMSFFLVY